MDSESILNTIKKFVLANERDDRARWSEALSAVIRWGLIEAQWRERERERERVAKYVEDHMEIAWGVPMDVRRLSEAFASAIRKMP